jgi:hypothetical protein
VDEVLTTLGKAGLSLKLKKILFFKDAVEYLGHVIWPCRLEVAGKNTAALKDAKFPKTQTELKSFLGLCNVYRRFVALFLPSRLLSPRYSVRLLRSTYHPSRRHRPKRLTHYVRSCCRPRSWHFPVHRVNIFSIPMPPRRKWVAVYDRRRRMVLLSHWGIGRAL